MRVALALHVHSHAAGAKALINLLMAALLSTTKPLQTAKPELQLPKDSDAAGFHERVLTRCPTILSEYKPTPFLTNGHGEEQGQQRCCVLGCWQCEHTGAWGASSSAGQGWLRCACTSCT